MSSYRGIQKQPELIKRFVWGWSGIHQAAINLFRSQGRFSPKRFLAITIVGIALADVIAMFIVYYVRDWPYHLQVVLDAAIMAVIIFPLIYFLSFKPLILHIEQQSQADRILQARLQLIQFANTHSIDALLQYALDVVEGLTSSSISFFHFLEADQSTLLLQSWSTNTRENMCNAEGKGDHYDVGQAGIWADAARLRHPVIHNSYAEQPNRKGMPAGHALVIREMVVPVIRDNKIMAILGVGNKLQDYSANDVNILSTFADFAWDVIEKKKSENALNESEEKFRTILNWTYDWEKWLAPDGRMVYTSPSCERITGYTPGEFLADPGLLTRIIHPDDQMLYKEHQRIIHDASAGPVTIEYRIISRDGSEHWIEHICRPLFEPGGRYLGRRISNREITERKQAEKKILEQRQKEESLIQTIQTIQTDIARDLHDSLGQNISFLRMSLAHLSESKMGDQAHMQIQSMAKAADESYELIRALLAILQSGYSANPLSLFSHYAEQVAERSSIQIEITTNGDPKQLPPHQVRQLFYIFREALSNIEKYAGATRAWGEFIWNDRDLTLLISDNGRGFNLDVVPVTGHYGLKFMRERTALLKGCFAIRSTPGQGTTIEVVVPTDEQELFPISS